jgi:hypothetical protein
VKYRWVLEISATQARPLLPPRKIAAHSICSVVAAFAQAALTERDDIKKFFTETDDDLSCSPAASWSLLCGFMVAYAASDYLAVCFLEQAESALSNISILPANGWAVLV